MSRRKNAVVERLDGDEEDVRRKVGFLISTENDFKLTVFARKHRKDRSTVINEVLTEKLRGVVVSFRNQSSEAGEAA